MSQILGWQMEAGVPDSNDALFHDVYRNSQDNEAGFSIKSVAAGSINTTFTSNSESIFSNEYCMATLIGEPYWTSDVLANTAKHSGHAKALAEAYRQSGIDFFQHLKGPFSLAVLNKNDNSLVLAIDRSGIHPLYYTIPPTGTGIVFASRLEDIRKHANNSLAVNPQAIFDFFYFHMIPSPESIYTNCHKLLPGQYLALKNGEIKTGFYWQADFNVDNSTSITSLSHELMRLLRNSIRRYDFTKNTGAFLSGGIDSSTVTGLLSEIEPQSANTYSIGFDAAGYDEIEFARITASYYKTRQHEYYVTPEDVVDLVPKIAQAYDEPFGNASAIPSYYCARLAKEDGMQQLLAGDGGDELFAGNERYAQQKLFEWYGILPGSFRSAVLEPLVNRFPGGDYLPPVRKGRSYIQQANIPLPNRLQSYNFIERTAISDVFTSDFLKNIDTEHPHELMGEVYWRAQSDSILNRMLHMDWKITLADNDFRKVNRMCELAGITVHYPLMDDDIVEFSTKLPPEIKLPGLKLRNFFKESLQGFLPPQTLKKSKHGFGLPFGVWLKTSPILQEVAYDNLNTHKKRGYLSPQFIDKLITQHRSGHASFYGEMIWITMMLELWFQAHNI